MELKRINAKAKKYWMIRRLIFLIIFILGLVATAIYMEKGSLFVAIIIAESIIVLFQIFNTFILPFMQYNNYYYLIKDDEIIYYRGVIFKNSFVIPIVQIQDVGFIQGPIQILMNLSSLDISTAGSNHTIFGFTKEEVETLVSDVKEKIKKLVEEKRENE